MTVINYLVTIRVLQIIIAVYPSFEDDKFIFESVPRESGFRMEGYWIWGGSMIKSGSTYHLFASRWKKDSPFPEGYRKHSEIVRATSQSPLGPFTFREVIIGERDSIYWDSDMAHNPTIHKIGDEFVLFYIGSDYTTINNNGNIIRRTGYAKSVTVEGPWVRSDKPLINTESNNPAVVIDEEGLKMVFRDASLRVFLAEAENYRGPFNIINDNLWPGCKIEDFYMYKKDGKYHIICEDNVGGVSGHTRWGVHLISESGVGNWRIFDPAVVYDHDILYDDGTILHCVRRERPQLLIEDGYITHLITSVYDGSQSWCQPVKLKVPIRVDEN